MSVECPINKLAMANGHVGCNDECRVGECVFSGDNGQMFPVQKIYFEYTNEFVAKNIEEPVTLKSSETNSFGSVFYGDD